MVLKISAFLLAVCFAQVILAQHNPEQVFSDYKESGSFSLYNYNTGEWIFSDSLDAHRGTLPASTFKIVNSCIALETGAIADEHEIIAWDGVTRTFLGAPVPAWNMDTDLKEAYKNSTVWFYVELARRIGKKTYIKYLEECHYGNGDLSEQGDDFWNYGPFVISPAQQIVFLKNLYEKQLPFSERTYNKVSKIMVSEKTEDYTIRSKTGRTNSNGEDIGWWVGYIEKGDNVFFFATRLIKKENDQKPQFSKDRIAITKTILREMGIIAD